MIVIHTAEGKIVQTLSGIVDPESLAALDERGVLYADVDFKQNGNLHELFGLHHVVEGELALRPALAASVSTAEIRADGKDKAVISGLPKPCTVMVDGQPVERKGGTLTLTADVAATYRVAVDQWPYLPWLVEIVAT
jgi:hypothetical protein